MSDTCFEVDVTNLSEFEFATACVMPRCGQEAVAMYMRSHTKDGCWGPPVNMCAACLKRSQSRFDAWLQEAQQRNAFCVMCEQMITGLLSQNMRVIYL